MVFTSLNFLVFFPVVTGFFYLLPHKWRWPFLLAVSFFFYLNIKPIYIILLTGVIVSSYFFARFIEKTGSETNKKILLTAGILTVLFPLCFFKYYYLINHTIVTILTQYNLRWPLPDISYILPVGISFYTFMAIGYLLDVYNEEIEAEREIGFLALFLSFFPLVLSGPIERAGNMLKQFKSKVVFDYKLAVTGLQLILWGYFMKLVVADRIAIYLEQTFSRIHDQTGPTLLFSTLLYPIQVYGDLGGYSLIAIGCANVMGYRIMHNFQRPFFATSMSAFWQRWHISLISWLTDYVYTPLSFSLRKFRVWGIVLSLMLTFIISGAWHGAAFTFIFWGLLQGTILSIEALTKSPKTVFENKFQLRKRAWYLALSSVITYLLFAFSLLFGGAVASLSQSFEVLHKMVTNLDPVHIDPPLLNNILLVAGILLLSEFRDEYYPSKMPVFQNRNAVIRWCAYLATLIAIVLLGVFNRKNFIYFQF